MVEHVVKDVDLTGSISLRERKKTTVTKTCNTLLHAIAVYSVDRRIRKLSTSVNFHDTFIVISALEIS